MVHVLTKNEFVWHFWCPHKCDCHIHIRPNEPQQGIKQTAGWATKLNEAGVKATSHTGMWSQDPSHRKWPASQHGGVLLNDVHVKSNTVACCSRWQTGLRCRAPTQGRTSIFSLYHHHTCTLENTCMCTNTWSVEDRRLQSRQPGNNQNAFLHFFWSARIADLGWFHLF